MQLLQLMQDLQDLYQPHLMRDLLRQALQLQHLATNQLRRFPDLQLQPQAKRQLQQLQKRLQSQDLLH